MHATQAAAVFGYFLLRGRTAQDRLRLKNLPGDGNLSGQRMGFKFVTHPDEHNVIETAMKGTAIQIVVLRGERGNLQGTEASLHENQSTTLLIPFFSIGTLKFIRSPTRHSVSLI